MPVFDGPATNYPVTDFLDFGIRASRRAAHEPMLADAPPTSAPLIRALLVELRRDGHSMERIARELDLLLKAARR